jgi:hypothetical protein
MAADINAMEHPVLSSRMPIADILACSPKMGALFIELRVDCIGCVMKRFCNLEDLCRDYQLDLETVLATIRERLGSDPIPG